MRFASALRPGSCASANASCSGRRSCSVIPIRRQTSVLFRRPPPGERRGPRWTPNNRPSIDTPRSATKLGDGTQCFTSWPSRYTQVGPEPLVPGYAAPEAVAATSRMSSGCRRGGASARGLNSAASRRIASFAIERPSRDPDVLAGVADCHPVVGLHTAVIARRKTAFSSRHPLRPNGPTVRQSPLLGLA